MEAHVTTRSPHHAFFPRAADFKSLTTLAIPVVFSQVGLMTMGVVSTIMVGRISAANLAAVALGNLYVFALTVFAFGALTAIEPLVSQAVGARDEPAIGRALQRGLALAAALSVVAMLLCIPVEPVLRTLSQPEDVIPIAKVFVHIETLTIPPFLFFWVLRQTLQAMGHTRPVVMMVVLGNLVNLGLCFLFVFGHAGDALRGAPGAALAAVIARFVMLSGLLMVSWRWLGVHLRPIRREALAPGPFWNTLRLGAPLGALQFLEFGIFGTIALLMGRFGTVPVAAHQVAINLASLTFMVPMGIGAAGGVRVGQAVGAGDAGGARRAAGAALTLGVSFMLICAAAFVTVPTLFARIYTNDAAVMAMAASLIPIAGVFQVFDGLQVVSIGMLRGVGDTRAPMIVALIGYWFVGVPVSLWLGYTMGLGPRGLWWGFVAGLAAVGLTLLTRVVFRLGRTLHRLEVTGHV
jgi:MATE family multidrug resistance protein